MKSIRPTIGHSRLLRILPCAIVSGTMLVSATAWSMTITPTFTTAFNTNFGANAAAAQGAWISAASDFTSNFSDNIHINITVDAVSGTSVFGQSSTSLVSASYATLRNDLIADSKTVTDAMAVSLGGSITVADPTAGAGKWWVSKAQAKAIGLIADSLTTDGTTRFGTGFAFTFSGPVAAGTYDFKGIAEHEISEVMGRLGISGGTIGSFANSYSLIDAFAFTAPGTRGLVGGPGEYFSVDDGTTLEKLWNDPTVNHLDSRDWAPGSNDSFNQFSNSGVVNGLSTTDLKLMDAIGYDRVVASAPDGVSSFALLSMGIGALIWLRRKVYC
jgi:hypothetical protein